MTNRQYLKRKYILSLCVVLLALAAVNWLVSSHDVRWDLTGEKRYTLSPATRQLLRRLDGPVKIRVFMQGKFPAAFRHLQESTRELLEEFRRYAGRNIDYEFVNPLAGLPDSVQLKVKDSLAAMGIMPYNVRAQQNLSEGVSVQLIFPGALVDYNGHELPVNLLQGQPGADPLQTLNQAGAKLEYEFAHAIYQLQQKQPPLVGYAIGNGEPLGPEVYQTLLTVQQNYSLDTVNLVNLPFIPHDFDALLIVRPDQRFSEEEKLKLDQYVMQGGKILWFINPVNASMDSLKTKPSFIAFDRGLNLEDLLFGYGIRVNPDLVQDLQCFSTPVTVGSLGNSPQIEQLPWPYYPLLSAGSDHPVVKNMDLVLGQFASSLDTIHTPGIRHTVLLATSAYSRRIGTPVKVSLEEEKVAPDPRQFNQKHIPVAVLLEGRFSSVFRNRLSAQELAHIDSVFHHPYTTESVAGKMIVVSDASIATNAVSLQDGPLPMGMDPYTRQQFANREFFLNCLSYLTGGATIMEARNKDYKLRLLDAKRVEAEKGKWVFLNFAIPIGFVLLFGLVFQYLRQRKYGGS